MKITMDKDMTESYMIDRTKAQMKEFKEMFTDGDLLRMFREAVNDTGLGYNYEIIRCNLRAFPGGTQETDETHYCVEMLLEGFREFIKLHFYIDQSCNIDTRRQNVYMGNGTYEWMDMYSIEHYKVA